MGIVKTLNYALENVVIPSTPPHPTPMVMRKLSELPADFLKGQCCLAGITYFYGAHGVDIVEHDFILFIPSILGMVRCLTLEAFFMMICDIVKISFRRCC